MFPPWTVWWYVLREHVGPFFFAFVVIFFILVLDLLVDVMDAILGKGLDAGVVIRLFLLNFAWMVALAVPMAVLIAVLMAFGRLANDNEIMALMASGVSPVALVLPSLAASILIAGALIWFNNAVLPDSNYHARVLMASVHRRKPAISLKDREGMFITDFPGHVLRINRVLLDSPSPLGPVTGSRLEGIEVYEYDEGGREPPALVTARAGTIELWRGGAVVRLVLYDGEMVQVDRENAARDLRTEFDAQTIIINDYQRGEGAAMWDEEGHRGDRELSAGEMLGRAAGYRTQVAAVDERIDEMARDTLMTESDRRIQIGMEQRLRQNFERYIDRYMVEVHKKYSIPVACLVFVLIGAPLGMMARGAGRTAAIGVGLALFLLYWASLIGGENLADQDHIQPWLAMWGANIVVGTCGVLLLAAVSHNVRVASLLEALPRALEARRLRRRQEQEAAA